MAETVEDFLKMNYDCKENGSKLKCEIGDTEIAVDARTREKPFTPENVQELTEEIR